MAVQRGRKYRLEARKPDALHRDLDVRGVASRWHLGWFQVICCQLLRPLINADLAKVSTQLGSKYRAQLPPKKVSLFAPTSLGNNS